MSCLHCPRCRLAIRCRADYLTMTHCPRCLARAGMRTTLFASPLNADIIIVVMRENGYSAIEKTMIDNDEAERVIRLREDFQRVMGKRYSDVIERLTGRTVVAFLNRAHLEPDLSMKVFFIDRPLDGFGTGETIDRQDLAQRSQQR